MVENNIKITFLGFYSQRGVYGDRLVEEFNILKHELVPEHIILSENEKKKLLEKFKIKPKNLPKILTTDPVSKVLNAKEGDILKIIRRSETAGTSTYYRIVVKKKK